MKTITKKVSPTSKGNFGESHISMLTAVIGLVLGTTYLSVTQSLAAFYNLMLGIQSNLATIQSLRFIVRIPITGYAANKKAVKAGLVQLTSTVMNATFAYAKATNNDLLAQQMISSPSALNKMSYVKLVEFTGGIIAIVNPLATGGTLTDYNVTPTTVTAWQALWTQMNAIIADPKVAIANRVGLNDSIYALIRECMVTLTNQCDTLVSYFKTSNTAYYMSYWSARKLNEHHVSTQGRFYVLDYEGSPVTEGEVFIIGTSKSAALDNNGYAMIDHIPFGSHKVSLTTIYGTEMSGPFDFKKGKVLTLHYTVGVAPVSPVTSTEEDFVDASAGSANAKKI